MTEVGKQNGQDVTEVVTCLKWEDEVGCWTVKLDYAGESYKLKPQNLVLRPEGLFYFLY